MCEPVSQVQECTGAWCAQVTNLVQEANLLLGGVHVHIHMAAWQPHLLQWQRAAREVHDTVQCAQYVTECLMVYRMFQASSSRIMHVERGM